MEWRTRSGGLAPSRPLLCRNSRNSNAALEYLLPADEWKARNLQKYFTLQHLPEQEGVPFPEAGLVNWGTWTLSRLCWASCLKKLKPLGGFLGRFIHSHWLLNGFVMEYTAGILHTSLQHFPAGTSWKIQKGKCYADPRRIWKIYHPSISPGWYRSAWVADWPT